MKNSPYLNKMNAIRMNEGKPPYVLNEDGSTVDLVTLHRDLIKSIRLFSASYIELSGKLDKATLTFGKDGNGNEIRMVAESAKEAVDELHDLMDEVVAKAKRVMELLEKYRIAGSIAASGGKNIADFLDPEEIKLDVAELGMKKKEMGIARQRIHRIMEDGKLHENPKAMECLISLNGGVVNGKSVKGYADEISGNVKEIVAILKSHGGK